MDAVEFVRVIKRMLNAAPIKGSNHVITSFVVPEEEVARIETEHYEDDQYNY